MKLLLPHSPLIHGARALGQAYRGAALQIPESSLAMPDLDTVADM